MCHVFWGYNSSQNRLPSCLHGACGTAGEPFRQWLYHCTPGNVIRFAVWWRPTDHRGSYSCRGGRTFLVKEDQLKHEVQAEKNRQNSSWRYGACKGFVLRCRKGPCATGRRAARQRLAHLCEPFPEGGLSLHWGAWLVGGLWAAFHHPPPSAPGQVI